MTQQERAGKRFSAVLAIAFIGLLAGNAGAVPAISSSGGGPPGIAFSGFTKVARLRVPPGSHAITTTGVVRNDDTTNVVVRLLPA